MATSTQSAPGASSPGLSPNSKKHILIVKRVPHAQASLHPPWFHKVARFSEPCGSSCHLCRTKSRFGEPCHQEYEPWHRVWEIDGMRITYTRKIQPACSVCMRAEADESKPHKYRRFLRSLIEHACAQADMTPIGRSGFVWFDFPRVHDMPNRSCSTALLNTRHDLIDLTFKLYAQPARLA